MCEAFLQYIWGQRLYYTADQMTTDGSVVEILNPGRLNQDAGPDFFNAQIRVEGVTWAGNVEIHLTSDDWYRHGHETDPAYDNVILHVVGRSTGRQVLNSKGDKIPEVVLAYDPELLQRYEELESRVSVSKIRCADLIPKMPEAIKTSWLDSLLIERMEAKSDRILEYVEMFKGDIDQAFFCVLARAMGNKVNAEPMEILVRSTPLRALVKHNDVLQTEALLLGQAGMLRDETLNDDYVTSLRREYDLLKVKFGLEPIDPSVWKYARLRPQNFPDIRLVQLAAVIRALPGNFASCLSLPLNKILSVSPSEYWRTHYRLGLESNTESDKKLGEDSRRLVMINAIVPYAFAMGRRFGNVARQDEAIDVLRAITKERNSILRMWTEVGVVVRDEADAQALLHLTSQYCERGMCLRCRFGHYCISRGRAPVAYASLGSKNM